MDTLSPYGGGAGEGKRTMIKHLKRFISLPVLVLLLSGCPGPNPNQGFGTDALTYTAGFVLDTKNNLHLVYNNSYAQKLLHLEKKLGEGWKSELIDPSAPITGFEQAQIEGGILCVYMGRNDSSNRFYYRACREKSGNWILNKLAI